MFKRMIKGIAIVAILGSAFAGQAMAADTKRGIDLLADAPRANTPANNLFRATQLVEKEKKLYGTNSAFAIQNLAKAQSAVRSGPPSQSISFRP